jgi:SSS family solute:Na+ symporter
MSEFFDKRFGGKLAEPTRALATLITLSFTWLAPAAYLAGISVIGNVLLGVETVTMAIVVTSICFILSLTGGLMTAIKSDIVAFIMIIIFIPILFLIGWNAAGGFEALSQVFEPKFLSLKPVWDIDDFHFGIVLTWGFQVTLLYIAAPWYGQRIFSAKNAKIAYNGMLINTILLAVLYGLVALTTMFSRVLMPNLDSAEQALPMLILNYTPPILQGLLLVTLLLVGMSTIIAVWNSAVSIVINDLFKRYLVKDKSERFYINASRVAFIIIGITTMLNGLSFIGNILQSVIYLQVFTCMLAFPILAGIYWRRFNTKAAMISMLGGITYCAYAISNTFPSYLISPIGVVVSVVLGILVTLSTKQDTPREDIEKFYKIIHNPKETPGKMPEKKVI